MKKVLLLILVISTGYVFGQNHLVGITYEYQLSKKFNIGLDLIYAQSGFKYDVVYSDEFGNSIGEGVTSDFNNNYLSIPIKAGFSTGNSFYGFINLGLIPLSVN